MQQISADGSIPQNQQLQEMVKLNSYNNIGAKKDIENSIKMRNDKKIRKKWSKKKIALITSLSLVCITIATFCAIYFTMDHSRIQTQLLRSGTGEVKGQSISYQEYSVQVTYKDNTKSEMKLIAMQQKNVTLSRMLQETETQQQVDINCYVANVNNLNETYRFCNHQTSEKSQLFQLDTLLNGPDLINEIKNYPESENRRLQSVVQDLSLNHETGAIQVENQDVNSFISSLKDEGINLQFNLNVQVNIENHKETDYGNNSIVNSQKMENLTNPETSTSLAESDSPNPQNRMLRWKWFKKLFKKIVKVIKKCAPIIGAVVGGVIGAAAGLAGGPSGVIAGAIQGAKTGYVVGQVVSSVVGNCFPTTNSGNVKVMNCDYQSLGKDALNLAPKLVENSIGKDFSLTANLKQVLI